MAKKNSLTLGFENSNRTANASNDQTDPCGMKATFRRLAKMFPGYFADRRRHRAADSYLPCTASEEAYCINRLSVLDW
jgi:hypothetical protein